MARRRAFNVISMSFLDAMTCGFGAVILFFMIISANVDQRRDRVLENRSAEARRLELQLNVGQKNLAELREALSILLASIAENQAARDQIDLEIEKTEQELRRLLEDESASEETIEQLKADLARLESEKESLASDNDTIEATGNYIRQVRGEGYRQYLTGMRMGGEHVLILVDASGSMLGTSYPAIVRRRLMSDADKLATPKWRQVVDSVDWLTAQIEPETKFQIIAFNTEAWPVLAGTNGQWLTASDGDQLDQAVTLLGQTIPEGGTSLHPAFEAMRELNPPPDNVYLLVDGLPTQGATVPTRPGVTGVERMRHFTVATRGLSTAVPINVLLYALEGDPQSVTAYWALALSTGGSLMAPSEDWP